MADKFSIGARVKWKWGNGWGRGEVKERFTEKVTRTIDGSEVTRNASEDDPAYMVHQEDGDRVLKAQSELQKDN